MKPFVQYFTKRKIILNLCKIRATLADNRSKKHQLHLLTNNTILNYHLYPLDPQVELLNKIMPPRRKWKKLNKNQRYSSSNQRINTIEYNKAALFKTVLYYRKQKPNEPFILELNHFIKSVLSAINDPNYEIDPPEIIPVPKDPVSGQRTICRPISHFALKDRIILSITNKYLTDALDQYFYPNSFAFRASQGGKRVNHHASVQNILDYKSKYKGKRLWVSECDIKKFFDSVHHTIVKKQYQKLIAKLNRGYPGAFDKRADGIFKKYLECYTFPKNVLPYNSATAKSKNYWEKHKKPAGEFGWVEDDLKQLGLFKDVRKARIGIPQGGALSGLIANIVLNFADQQLVQSNDQKLLYVRFCDDMVLIHPTKKNSVLYTGNYYKALKDLHLIPHKPKPSLTYTADSFWDRSTKSKSPYKWSLDAFPWFSFVGYEIHYSGDLRVRKSSLKKEKAKQKEVVQKVIGAIESGLRKNDRTVFESTVNRLIGMSVGRVKLDNYKIVESEMCWVSGFPLLNDNKHIRAQLRGLDNNRSKNISRLKKVLGDIDEDIKPKDDLINVKKTDFLQIDGCNASTSEKIHYELQVAGLLDSQCKISRTKKLKPADIEVQLPTNYKKYSEEIARVLKKLTRGRAPVYYGKPFSYYYHVIEKRKQ